MDRSSLVFIGVVILVLAVVVALLWWLVPLFRRWKEAKRIRAETIAQAKQDRDQAIERAKQSYHMATDAEVKSFNEVTKPARDACEKAIDAANQNYKHRVEAAEAEYRRVMSGGSPAPRPPPIGRVRMQDQRRSQPKADTTAWTPVLVLIVVLALLVGGVVAYTLNRGSDLRASGPSGFTVPTSSAQVDYSTDPAFRAGYNAATVKAKEWKEEDDLRKTEERLRQERREAEQ